MLKLIRRISSDDGAVKVLFDHVRNVGICAVVFGAAAWQYKNLEPAGYIYYFQALIVGLLVVVGLFPFFCEPIPRHGQAAFCRLSEMAAAIDHAHLLSRNRYYRLIHSRRSIVISGE